MKILDQKKYKVLGGSLFIFLAVTAMLDKF